MSRLRPEQLLSRARFLRVAATGGLLLLVAACAGIPGADYFGMGSQPPPPPAAQPAAVGAGQVKVALILPLTAPGNAGATAQSMRNAAEMALAEFNNPDIQLLVKDDGGTAPGAQAAAQQAVAEGAEVILGPLFAQSVGAAGQVARQRGIPVIAFSTDSTVAAPGVHLLSCRPESDVDRAIDYATRQGKRSFAALIPDNAYGTVVQAAFQQAVAAHGGRVVVMERYPLDRALMVEPRKRVVQAALTASSMRSSSGRRRTRSSRRSCEGSRRIRRREHTPHPAHWHRPVGRSAPCRRARRARRLVRGAGSVPGYRAFLGPLSSSHTGQDPAPARNACLRCACRSVAALGEDARPGRSFSEEILTNASGFAGIDGVFRFKPERHQSARTVRWCASPRAVRSAGGQPRTEGISARAGLEADACSSGGRHANPQSALRLAARTTLPHFSVSSADAVSRNRRANTAHSRRAFRSRPASPSVRNTARLGVRDLVDAMSTET